MSIAAEVFRLFDEMVRAEQSEADDATVLSQMSEDILANTKAVWPEVLGELLFVPKVEEERGPQSMVDLAQRLSRLQPEITVSLPTEEIAGQDNFFVATEGVAMNFDGFDDDDESQIDGEGKK